VFNRVDEIKQANSKFSRKLRLSTLALPNTESRSSITNAFRCQRLPARLTVEQTALLLGFLTIDIPVLVRAGLLKCLGRPAPDAHKCFSAVEIVSPARDGDWLDKATRVLGKHAREKNQIGPSATTGWSPKLAVGTCRHIVIRR